MCYPDVGVVAAKIKRFVAWQRKRSAALQPSRGGGGGKSQAGRRQAAEIDPTSHTSHTRVFLATDSPDPSTFEGPLAELLAPAGIVLRQAAPEPAERHADDQALLVDQVFAVHYLFTAFP